MTDHDERTRHAADVRSRAEEVVCDREAASEREAVVVGDSSTPFSAQQARQQLHELQVHQIELEMQNEELRRTQLELDAARSRYFDLYDLAPMGYCTLTDKGLIVEANLKMAEMLGLSRSALVQQPFSRYVFPDDRDAYYLHRRHLMQPDQPQSCQLRMVGPGSTTFWGHLESAPAGDEAGAPTARVILIDITERRRAEEDRARLLEQLHQSQKMESVGRLAGGVAHDFNNMLLVILGHAELALSSLEPDDPVYADLKAIHTAAERSADLTRQLLAFARKQTVVPIVLDLNKVVEGTLKMLHRLIGEAIELSWKPVDPLWPVMMDRSQADQILANLVVNARDAIGGVGKVVIETTMKSFDQESIGGHEGCVAGDYVGLVVSDSGCGMNAENLAQIFEPFFTTKELGKGTGLGLPLVYGIVKQNNGFINVYSEPGQGTIFRIFLPRHRGEVAEAPKATNAQPVPRGCETVLLVEDELTILKMTRSMLTRLGYTVLAANSPKEALHLARERRGDINLLITDVVMPEMNGRELAASLRALMPSLKCLFMSGYTANVISSRSVLDDGAGFLQKPFSIPELATAVREALARE